MEAPAEWWIFKSHAVPGSRNRRSKPFPPRNDEAEFGILRHSSRDTILNELQKKWKVDSKRS